VDPKLELDRWHQITNVCAQALELPASERAVFLAARCGGDESLRAEVESLLSAAAKSSPLDSNALLKEFQPEAIIAGRFRIIRWIARGGMGEVYEAEDPHLGERVALKTIRPELSHDSNFMERFKREIQVAKKVTHTNVCRIYDVGFHPSSADPNARMFLTMEFLSGQTLSERLAAGPMTTAEALPLITQLAEALGAAHRAGVIHRDFKSGNIMLTSQRDGIRAVVMDFGLARTFRDSSIHTEETVTETGGFAGTPEYMAPEQLTGGRLSPSTDIYALGIVIYEMISGRRPFAGRTPLDGAIQRLHQPPPTPRELVPDLDPRWEAAILRCLGRRPEDRFQSASELVIALSGNSRSGARWIPRIPWRRRRVLAVASAIVILSATIAMLAVRSQKKPLPQLVDWQQLTNFTDSATDPALSPDGRMLAFKRGGSWFMDPGEIYVKLLPDGAPVQLTRDLFAKMSPAFSPDGSRVAYSVRRADGVGWETWAASVLPGSSEPRALLRNAEGLTWIDRGHVMFSEPREPHPLMSVLTSTESRTEIRDVYIPQNAKWMAHFSALSPDRKQVLIVEMQPDISFFPCRLVPFDASYKGRQVGPARGECIAASWSPDGKWMYFSVRTNDPKFHLWRQRADAREPEQITFGPTEERGLAVAPDGRSLVTSVGEDFTTLWVHDATGDRQISAEGNAGYPEFSADGKKVYHLADASEPRGTRGPLPAAGIWVTDLESGRTERVLPGVAVSSYAISPDRKAVVYTALSGGGLWYVPLDGGVPPHRIGSGFPAGFTLSGDILFRGLRDSKVYVIHADGTDAREVAESSSDPDPIHPGYAVSPDQQWSMGFSKNGALVAYPRGGGRPLVICEGCSVSWTADGRFLRLKLIYYTGVAQVTALIHLRDRSMFPELPAAGIRTLADLRKVPGVQIVPSPDAVPSPIGGRYAFIKMESRWNLYRVPLR
jgi:serine/threonine protein kinase